jgi:hypothetical protein
MLPQYNQSPNVVKKFLFFINGNLVIFKRKIWIYSERTFFFLFFAFWPNFAPKENIGHHTNANHNLGFTFIW